MTALLLNNKNKKKSSPKVRNSSAESAGVACLVVEPIIQRVLEIQVEKESSVCGRSKSDLSIEGTDFSQSKKKNEDVEPGFVSMAKFLQIVFPLRLLGLANLQKEWKCKRSK